MIALKNLSISRIEWGEEKGRLRGKIGYDGENGTVELSLSAKDCENLLPLIAQSIVNSSREIAEQLTQEAMQSIPAPDLKIG
jgi:hypothetical protein